MPSLFVRATGALTTAFTLLALPACATLADLDLPGFGRNAPEVTLEDVAMRWDHRPEAGEWTRTAFTALETHAAILPTLVPNDIAEWCPAYPDATQDERQLFWTGLLSALARHESTWNPQAVGGGGRWFGLVQISPATARHYACQATSGSALQNGSANISCALRIWAQTVPRDGVVAAGRGGIAADWGPFVQANKREEMRAWISSQPYCAQ
ncbi:transglycosylase SLT domain-containing protein [Gymnodinialimonas hymeniacidonis]|uniref:transglycosylase SLT domain-containing protein n=1 Tax=Gymnodinialimonas hymeniacidonis TaxID=3126508 RepID=UPI0034C697EC